MKKILVFILLIPALLSAALVWLKPDQAPETVDSLPSAVEFASAYEGEFIEGLPVRYVVARVRQDDGKRGTLLLFDSFRQAEAIASKQVDWGFRVTSVRPTDFDFLQRRKPGFIYQPYEL